jgi:hypothetical protein
MATETAALAPGSEAIPDHKRAPARPGWIVGVAALDLLAVGLGSVLYVLAGFLSFAPPRSELPDGWPTLDGRVYWIGAPAMYLTLMVVAVAVITFFGFIHGMSGAEQPVTDAIMRSAVTAALVVTDLVLIGIVAFYRAGGPMPPLTAEMIRSFTALVGVAIAFYFGATAVVQLRQPGHASAASTGGASPSSPAPAPGTGASKTQ